jgi:hypothetical protein
MTAVLCGWIVLAAVAVMVARAKEAPPVTEAEPESAVASGAEPKAQVASGS